MFHPRPFRSLVLTLRSQESLVSGVDDVISSQPYVTDPNEAWGDEPRSRQGPVTDLNDAWGDHPHSRHGPVSGDVISRDPFGALSQPFANGDDFAAKESSTKDPFEYEDYIQFYICICMMKNKAKLTNTCAALIDERMRNQQTYGWTEPLIDVRQRT